MLQGDRLKRAVALAPESGPGVHLPLSSLLGLPCCQDVRGVVRLGGQSVQVVGPIVGLAQLPRLLLAHDLHAVYMFWYETDGSAQRYDDESMCYGADGKSPVQLGRATDQARRPKFKGVPKLATSKRGEQPLACGFY